MQIVLTDCFVSSVIEGVGRESGNPYMRIDFIDMGGSRHEYSVFVNENNRDVMRTVPTDGRPVCLYFEVSRGRNMSIQLDLVGWTFPEG